MFTITRNIRLPSKYVIVLVFISIHLILSFYLASLHQRCTVSEELVNQIKKLSQEIEYYTNRTPKSSESSIVEESTSITTKSYYIQDSLEQSQLLNRNYGPNTVYYVWCGKRWFEFTNYISVKSVIKSLRPDSIFFLYDYYPMTDDWKYNTWFKELLEEYPFLRALELANKNFACSGHARTNLEFVSALLTDRGGFYFNEYTIIADFAVDLRASDLVDAWDYTKQSGFLFAKKGLPGNRTFKDRTLDKDLNVRKLNCHSDIAYSKANRKSSCVIQMRPYFPKDIWNLENSFGKLVRNIFYGNPKILSPQPVNDNLIPNIAHVVWLGGGPMDFLFFLCILSLIHVAKVEAVYLHGDGPPTGAYWDLVKNDKRLHIILREHPGAIYNQPINVVSHVTDVWRVDFMIKYGGIYVDTDTIFIKALDARIRQYDAVASYDWTYWNHPFPDTINFGVSLGKRNAEYWHLFQESMRWFIDTDWAWNGLRQPYKVMERRPDLVLIDPHLSVICYLGLCHPTWHPDYHNESVHHLNSDSITDWRNDAYAFHWTLPTPYELANHTSLFATNTMFSDIAKFVLEEADLFDYFKNLVDGKFVSNKMP